MNENEKALLASLGINIIDLSDPLPGDNNSITARGKFYLVDDVFGPMSRLIKITDMIVNSNNPAVNEMFGHLVTMLELTKENNS